MKLHFWLKELLDSIHGSTRCARIRRTRRTCLHINPLEDRCLPSTTIVYNQITSVTSNGGIPQFSAENVLSADGNRAAFATNGGQTYVVNSDGTGLTLVDPNNDNNIAISADGSVVMDTTGHG